MNRARAAVRGSSPRLTACSQASWVAWRMVNRKLRRWPTWRAGKLRRRAGCWAASGPGWKLPSRWSSSQTSAAVAGSSKASAVTRTRYRSPPAAQSTSARSRRPSGVVGVAKVSS
jgi:hypothetical protein